MKYLYYSLFLYAVLFACKKDKPDPPPDNGIGNCDEIQNVKKYFYFKLGSWWVYEEVNSGDRDSVYVTEAGEDPSSYYFDVRVYSTYQGYYYHFWPIYASGAQNCVENGEICKWCVSIKRSKYVPGDFIGEGYCFLYLIKTGDYLYSYNSIFPNNIVSVTDDLDSFQNAGLEFNRTIKIHELNTFIEDKQPTNHYFSEGVGLVRKELLDSNQVWNLVDYHIAN